MSDYFRVFRVISTTRPDFQVGLLTSFGASSRASLEALDPEDIGFYVEDLVEHRDEEARTEQFMLQGSNSLDGPWEDIKSFQPAAGSDESEPDFGKCMRCGAALEESEFAIGDACDGCRPTMIQEWEDKQDRLAEEAAEARWIM
jgi:hypothetical protein